MRKKVAFVPYYKYEHDGSQQLEFLLFADHKSIILRTTAINISARTWGKHFHLEKSGRVYILKFLWQ
jgi:hypothetical protein